MCESVVTAPKSVAAIDTEIAYITAYDAMRIAVTAHMISLGYRVRAVAAAHEAVGIYAEAMINSPSTGEYQRIRRCRNKSEYDDITIGTADLTADLAHAAAVIQAVLGAL